MTSIRGRLTVLALGLFAVALFFAALFMLQAQRRSLESALDVSLQTRADDIVALLEQGLRPDGLGINADEDAFAMVIGPAGDVITTTDRFGNPQELLAVDLDAGTATTALDSFAETAGLDRVRVTAVDGPRGERVFVGESLRRIDNQVADLRTALLITNPVLALAAAAITAFAVRRALQPVEAMRHEVDQISLAGLDRRLATPRRADELGQLAATFNAMLARLQTATKSQQQLTADIAHELRSPVTAIAALHEVDIAHPKRAEWATTATEVLDETRRLQRLIDSLLLLARIDADTQPIAQDLVDLDDIVNATIDRLQPTTDIVIDHRRVSAGLVRGDATQLQQVVENLLDNAIRHAETTITISLTDNGSIVELIVTNDGDTINGQDSERIFDRFYRTQDARDRHSGGTGLGLAITKAILSLHQATITAAPTHPGTTVTTSLPSVDDTAASDTA